MQRAERGCHELQQPARRTTADSHRVSRRDNAAPWPCAPTAHASTAVGVASLGHAVSVDCTHGFVCSNRIVLVRKSAVRWRGRWRTVEPGAAVQMLGIRIRLDGACYLLPCILPSPIQTAVTQIGRSTQDRGHGLARREQTRSAAVRHFFDAATRVARPRPSSLAAAAASRSPQGSALSAAATGSPFGHWTGIATRWQCAGTRQRLRTACR